MYIVLCVETVHRREVRPCR